MLILLKCGVVPFSYGSEGFQLFGLNELHWAQALKDS